MEAPELTKTAQLKKTHKGRPNVKNPIRAKTKNQGDDKPQGVRRGVRRAVAAGVLLSFWPAGEALAVDAGATVPACVEFNQ